MKESPKAASDDEKSADKHELFLKSLSASINSYNLKDASNAGSVPSSPKKNQVNRISDVSDESKDLSAELKSSTSSSELKNTYQRRNSCKSKTVQESSSSSDANDSV